MSKPLEREPVLAGYTYKIKWPESDHAIYVTINDIEQDPAAPGAAPRRRPFEIFINTRNLEHYAWTVALTRMISAVFRRGGDVAFVADELKAVFDPQGGRWIGGHYVPSLLAAIGEVIENHMICIGFLAGKEAPDRYGGSAAEPRSEIETEPRPQVTPRPGRPALSALLVGVLRQRGRVLGLPLLRIFALRLAHEMGDCAAASRFQIVTGRWQAAVMLG